MTDRIGTLLTALESRPNDPFIPYALAIEYKNGGDTTAARRFFEDVRARFPAYVPTYLHLGALLNDLGDTDGARTTYAEGITRARAAGDGHALSELTDALDLLPTP
jgi:predicted Zn-dependent protease